MATNKRKAKNPSLQERQVLALERIAGFLDSLDEGFLSKSGLPIALCTSWADGSVFPLDVFVHKERPKGRPSDSE
jgi:hypothetical protein